MSRFVECREKSVWKFDASNDGSVDGLFHLHENVGLGEHHFCLSSEEAPFWIAVDPMKEPFEGEVLLLSSSEISKLEEYLKLNTPKINLFKRVFSKKTKTSDLFLLIASIIKHSKGYDKSEYLSWL